MSVIFRLFADVFVTCHCNSVLAESSPRNRRLMCGDELRGLPPQRTGPAASLPADALIREQGPPREADDDADAFKLPLPRTALGG